MRNSSKKSTPQRFPNPGEGRFKQSYSFKEHSGEASPVFLRSLSKKFSADLLQTFHKNEDKPSLCTPSQRQRGTSTTSILQRKGSSTSVGFSKSTNDQNRVLNHQTPDIELPCHNHPGKVALFWVTFAQGKRPACGKCALAYTKQGLECVEMDAEKEELERSSRLEEFLAYLKEDQLKCAQLSEVLLSASEEFFGNEKLGLSQVSNYYDSLVMEIIQRKEAHLAQLKLQNEEVRIIFSEAISELKIRAEEFDKVLDDINENKPNIIQKIEMDAFNLIIGKYEEKLESFRELVSEINSKRIKSAPFTSPPSLLIENSLRTLCSVKPTSLTLVERAGMIEEDNQFEQEAKEGDEDKGNVELATRRGPSNRHFG